MEYLIERIDNVIYDYNKQIKTVSPHRQEVIGRHRNDEDRHRSLAATLLLDRLLRKRGLRECDMTYGENEHGKPYFEGINICLSISHSGHYAAVCIDDSEIGIDIESVRDVNMKIAERFFTDDERESIRCSDDFFRIWTMKESFIKAIGKGLSCPLGSFSVINSDNQPYVEYDGRQYRLITGEAEGCKYSICKEEHYAGNKG